MDLKLILNGQKRASEVKLCPDCDRLLTSDDWMEGDPPNLQINRRRWPSRDETSEQCCMLCSIIRQEFDFQEDLIVGDHLVLGCRLQNGDHLGKKTSLELLWLNKRKGVGDGHGEPEAYASPVNGFTSIGQLNFSIVADNGSQYLSDAVSYSLIINIDGPVGQIISGRLAEREVGSDRSLETIRRWIQHCDDHHSSCPNPKKGKLPRRLIDISSLYSDATVKLHTTSKELVSYVALSYCWGDSTPITTTSSNVKSFSQGIPVLGLPQSIQDAIIVTYGLGFRYLWVDALCIIQDDNPEKAEEMADMANIYRHAAVTIIAAAAQDSNQGFLHTREEIPVAGIFTLPISLPGRRFGRVSLCRDEEQIYRYPPEPISKRAWTLQESILSPRCLIFATQQVFWKCTKAFWKDGGFTDWPTFQKNSGCWTNLGLAYTNQGIASFGGGDFVAVESALHPARSELAKRWFKVAEAYSSRKLSVTEDKLPALSSIAAMYHDILRDDYLAGLWRSSLIAGLLWVSNAQEENRPDRTCPTWSWFSIDSPVQFIYFYHPVAEWQSFAKIHNCNTTPLFDFAPYGQLKEGSFLEISGPTFTMIVEHSYGQGPDRFTLSSLDPSAPVLTSFFPDVKMHDYADMHVECLVLVRTTWQSWTAAGLVLCPCNLEKALYKRIGYFEAGPGSRQTWTESERNVLQASEWIFKAPMKSFTVV